ncbi:hypothetical protein ACVQ9Z_03810 [Staphylococcus aureus]
MRRKRKWLIVICIRIDPISQILKRPTGTEDKEAYNTYRLKRKKPLDYKLRHIHVKLKHIELIQFEHIWVCKWQGKVNEKRRHVN